MKIVIDIDQLLHQGKITQPEYDKLNALAQNHTNSAAFNILIGFGVIATAAGAAAFLPSSKTAILLGLLLAAAGLFFSLRLKKEWGLLGSILLVVGSVTAAAGLLSLTDGSMVGVLVVTVLCLTGAIFARSGLLAAFAALSLSATVGAMTSYEHATYWLEIRQPTLTVALFTVLALGSYHLSKMLPLDQQRVALIFSRTCLFVVNFGFWVGSLWGDDLSFQTDNWDLKSGRAIPDWVFAIAWAVALIVTEAWGVRSNKRWVVNVIAVFAAIHFYTQYFERLGASPGTLMIAGIVALGISLMIVRYNLVTRTAIKSEMSSPQASL